MLPQGKTKRDLSAAPAAAAIRGERHTTAIEAAMPFLRPPGLPENPWAAFGFEAELRQIGAHDADRAEFWEHF